MRRRNCHSKHPAWVPGICLARNSHDNRLLAPLGMTTSLLVTTLCENLIMLSFRDILIQ
jgi:hypothetical protein